MILRIRPSCRSGLPAGLLAARLAGGTFLAVKAAVYYETGGPEVFRYEEVPDPEVRPGGLLIQVEAVGVQGGDVLHRQGGAISSTPHIVGYQAAGTVRAVGDGTAGFAPGDPVVATMGAGSHAELVSVPAARAWRVPAGLSVAEAAGVPIEFATADDCLFEFGHLRAGETVLVQAGAGGVGLAAIQLAKAAGATVLATASSDDRLARLREHGMDHGINYRTADVAAEAQRLTDGRGVDLVVDPVGGRTLEGSIAALAYRGRISWVGRAGRDEQLPDVWPLMQKNATLTGVFLGVEMALNGARTHPLIEGLLDRAARGELRVVIDRTFPLAEAAAAHRYIESRRAFGRVLLIP
jgi:NADPH2:quinone reductase